MSPTSLLVAKLSAFAVAMFLFCLYVLPPMYVLLCEVTGIRKVGGAYEAVEVEVDTSRTITVQFLTTQRGDMPWEFYPVERKVTVHPGEKKIIKYMAHNPTDKPMVAQAVPSILPYNAVNFFHKIECFCFNHQPLAPGESAELDMFFTLDQELPEQVKNITLSYTLFDITETAEPQVAMAN